MCYLCPSVCVFVNTNINRPPLLFHGRQGRHRVRDETPTAGVLDTAPRQGQRRAAELSPTCRVWAPTRAVTSEGENSKNLLY